MRVCLVCVPLVYVRVRVCACAYACVCVCLVCMYVISVYAFTELGMLSGCACVLACVRV